MTLLCSLARLQQATLWTDGHPRCGRHVNAHIRLKHIPPGRAGVKSDLSRCGQTDGRADAICALEGHADVRQPGGQTRRKRRSDSPEPTAETSTAAPRSTATSAENAIVRGAAINVQWLASGSSSATLVTPSTKIASR